MGKGLPKKYRRLVLKTINGYRKASELIVEEKKQRLAQMRPEDSLCEYDNLCKLYATTDKKGLDKLEKRKILSLIRIRKAFNKTGKVNGNR